MKMCLNWKVIGGLAAVGLGIFLFAPNLFAAALPVLLIAICPLSMLLMMKAMGGMGQDSCNKDTDEPAKKPAGVADGRPDAVPHAVVSSAGASTGATSAELRAQLHSLQAQQTAIADQLEALDRDERERRE